jgi:hypothetical protein
MAEARRWIETCIVCEAAIGGAGRCVHRRRNRARPERHHELRCCNPNQFQSFIRDGRSYAPGFIQIENRRKVPAS